MCRIVGAAALKRQAPDFNVNTKTFKVSYFHGRQTSVTETDVVVGGKGRAKYAERHAPCTAGSLVIIMVHNIVVDV